MSCNEIGMTYAKCSHVTLEDARTFFTHAFDALPDVIASAPARVNLIGEHSDYNGGEVLPMAIGLRTYVAIRESSEKFTSVVSQQQTTIGTFDIKRPVKSTHWWDYVAGVAAQLRSRGVHLPQVQIAITSEVPSGAGLSSSAALAVASTLGLGKLGGFAATPEDIARIAWETETEFVGVPAGIMDQFASAMGRAGEALHIWCDTWRTEHLPFSENVLIFDSATPRELRRSEFHTRRQECEQAFVLLKARYPHLSHLAAATPAQVLHAMLPSPFRERALHVTQEQDRLHLAIEALRAQRPIPGYVLLESHESLRTLFECSTQELDWFVDTIMTFPGIRGARLTGAGWGGCAIATGESDVLANVQTPLVHEYFHRFGRHARTWIVRASSGADITNSLGEHG